MKDTAMANKGFAFAICFVVIGAVIAAPDPILDGYFRGENPNSDVGKRTRPVFTNTDYLLNIPGNAVPNKGVGEHGLGMPAMLPGIQLPNEKTVGPQPAKGAQLFNPFTPTVDAQTYFYNLIAQSQGVAVGGTNALNIPVNRLYPQMRKQNLPKLTPGQIQLLPQNPFHTTIMEGYEVERPETITAGRINFPNINQTDPGASRRFDLNGWMISRSAPDFINGALNVPLTNINRVWTMKGSMLRPPTMPEQTYSYGHINNPSNPFEIPIDDVIGTGSGPQNPVNPAVVGRRKRSFDSLRALLKPM